MGQWLASPSYMYIYIYIYMYTSMRTRTYVYAHAKVHIYMSNEYVYGWRKSLDNDLRLRTYMYIYIYVYIHIYLYTYIHTRKGTYVSVEWLYIYMGDAFHWTWHVNLLDITHSCLWNHPLRECDMAHSYAWHDTFALRTWFLFVCDISRLLGAAHCNTLQRTATHCNTLQQVTFSKPRRLALAATHCYALQHTATHCNTLQHTANSHLFEAASATMSSDSVSVHRTGRISQKSALNFLLNSKLTSEPTFQNSYPPSSSHASPSSSSVEASGKISQRLAL